MVVPGRQKHAMLQRESYEIDKKKMGRSRRVRSLAAISAKGLCVGLLAVSFSPYPVAALGVPAQLSNPGSPLSAHEVTPASLTIETKPSAAHHLKRANFEQEQRSPNAQHVADWVVDSGDNRGMPFVIVDKMDAKVFVFDADGQLRGAARALLGIERGDRAFDIGNRTLSQMRREEETTPAGRFVASIGFNTHGKDVLWVDYNYGIALHRVLTDNPRERRPQRLATSSTLDKRISHGCINVPANFFENVVEPTFTGTSGIVYVLPENHSNSEIFSSYYEVK